MTPEEIDDTEIPDEELQLLNRQRGAVALPRWGIAVVAVLLVHAPHLWQMGQWLWERPHYQAFPLILAGFAWLVSTRLPLIYWPEQTSFSIRHLLTLGTAGALFVLALRLDSNWLGLISCVGTLWASVWYFGGPSAAYELRGPFFFLALLIPLPLNLDLALIVSLQQRATEMASAGLEWFSVWHTVSGVAIRTSANTYLVEEACSGVHSLFTALTAILFLCFYCRYGGFRTVLLLLMTILWVVAANGVRVFLLVYSDSRFQVPLDDGWKHEALGFFTYATAILLTLSTDQLLRFVFPVMSDQLMDVQVDFHQRVRAPFAGVMFNLLDRPCVVGKLAVMTPAVLFAVVFVAGGSIATARMAFAAPNIAASPMKEGDLQRYVNRTSLPEQVSGWKLSDFREVSGDPKNPFGTRSSSWSYVGHGLHAIVSLDGYYSEWHDLSVCYTGLGWKLQSAKNDTLGDIRFPGKQLTIPHTEYLLYRNVGDHGFVLFSCFDSNRKPVTPPPASGNLLRTLKNRLQTDLFTPDARSDSVPPVFQIQVFVESEQELVPHEQQELVKLFNQLRSELLQDVTEVQ